MTTTADKTEVKTPALKDEVLALANKIETAMTIDKATGIVTTASDIYSTTLPDGITIETVNTIEKHNGNFIAASAHAIGTIAVGAMKENNGLASAETVITMGGRNELGLTVDRERTYRNPQDANTPIVKQGVVSITYDVVADNDSGQLKIARKSINSLAAAALKG